MGHPFLTQWPVCISIDINMIYSFSPLNLTCAPNSLEYKERLAYTLLCFFLVHLLSPGSFSLCLLLPLIIHLCNNWKYSIVMHFFFFLLKSNSGSSPWMPISSLWNEWYVSIHLFSSVRIMCRCAICGVISSSELDNVLWFVAGSQWIWRVRSILVQESGRWKEGCLLILKTAWVWSAVWSSVINMLSEFIWRTLHLTQTSESIAAQGLFRFWTRGWKHDCTQSTWNPFRCITWWK